MNAREGWLPDAQQRAFRAVLDGFARPGTRVPSQATSAWLMFLSVVLDESVSLADPLGLLDAPTRRLLLAPAASASQARFVLLDGRRPPEPGFEPARGTLESPELGATLLLCVDGLADASSPPPGARVLQLQGPGVPGTRQVAVTGLHAEWLACRAAWVAAYPLGVDLVLAAPGALVALPRTTRVQVMALAEER